MPCGERAAITVADVLRDQVAGLRTTHEQAKAAAHILACRTGRLGGHVAVCDRCGYTHFAYHSCRDRHCPTCGSLDQALWAEAQLQHLLPVSYFHLVFTVPASLRSFFARNGRALALRYPLRRLRDDPGDDGAEGTTSRRACRPPHLDPETDLPPTPSLPGHRRGTGPRRLRPSRSYLLPRRVLQIVFRAKLLEKLEALLRDRKADVGRHSGHELLRDARRLDWNIDIRRPLLGAEHVVRYFARYTRRIAISDRRLVRDDGHRVTFRWRDRADGNRQKLVSLEGSLFAQRFLQHVLPPRFVRIRRYGLLSNRIREGLLARCRELLDPDRPLMLAPPGETRAASCRRIFDVDLERCPKCRDGTLVVRARWRATRLPIDLVVATLIPRGS